MTLCTRTWEGPKPKQIQVKTLGCRGWTNAIRNQNFIKDLKNYELESRIEELESKFSKDFSEQTFNELRELKKTQKIN